MYLLPALSKQCIVPYAEQRTAEKLVLLSLQKMWNEYYRKFLKMYNAMNYLMYAL